jgi:hypothetical protein
MDNLISPSLRALENADHVTRRALLHLVTGLLAPTQIEGSAAPVAVPKKKKTEDEDNDAYPSVEAVDGSTKTLLPPPRDAVPTLVPVQQVLGLSSTPEQHH